MDNVGQDVMKNKEHNDATKDNTIPEELSDIGEKRKKVCGKKSF